MQTSDTIKINALNLNVKEFKQIVDNSIFGFFRTRINGEILYASKRVVEMFGYSSRKDFSKQNFGDFYMDKSLRPKVIKEIIQNDYFKDRIMLELKKKNGARIVVELSAYMNKELDYIDGFIIDITNEVNGKEDLQKLVEEMEQYRLAFNTSQDWVWLCSFDLEGKILDVSHNVKKITGYTKKELVENDDIEMGLVPKEYYPVLHKAWEMAVKKNKISKRYEYELIKKNGKRRFFEGNAIPLKRNKKIIGELAVGRDITRRKEAEDKLKILNKNLEKIVDIRTKALNQLNKRLAVALEDKISFFQKASHELRTPLTLIRGNLDFLTDKQKQQSEFEAINIQINKLSQIISDFSYLATDEHSKKQCFKKRLVDWKEVIEHVRADLNRVNESPLENFSCGIKISTAYKGAPSYLEKMLFHMVNNAVKFNNEEVKIKLTITDNSEGVIIICKDNGIGIPKKELKRIFEKFYQTERAGKYKKGGSGLGLAICKSVASIHGGEITIKSKIKNGASVKVFLPFEYE